MRTRTFDVPMELIGQLAELLCDNELSNQIEGVASNGDIIISVGYEAREKSLIEDIHEMIDEYNDDREDGEDGEDEDDDELEDSEDED